MSYALDVIEANRNALRPKKLVIPDVSLRVAGLISSFPSKQVVFCLFCISPCIVNYK